MSLDDAARQVLSVNPVSAAGRLTPLGNHGGFSGAQLWQFQATSGGYYRVNSSLNAAQAWDVTGVSAADGALVQLWAYGGGNNQQWLPVDDGGGAYHFVNRNSGKCLDDPSASTADSVQFVQYTCNGTQAQRFQVVPVTQSSNQIGRAHV